MPKEVLITLIIIAGSIFILYLLLFILALIFVLTFKKIMKQHSKSLMILINIKRENVIKIFEIFMDLNININPLIIEKLKEIDIAKFMTPDDPETKEVKELLSSVRDQAFLIHAQHDVLNENKDYLTAKSNILEIDKVYRTKVAMYNADVLGYNYWIKFLPTRFIFTIFKCKEKALI